MISIKLLLLAITCPIVLIGLVVTAIKNLIQTQVSILLFSKSRTTLGRESFTRALQSVGATESTGLSPEVFAGRSGSVRIKVRPMSNILQGYKAYKTENDAAQLAVNTHLSWASIEVSAPKAQAKRVEEVANTFAHALIDANTSAIWNSTDSIVHAVG